MLPARIPDLVVVIALGDYGRPWGRVTAAFHCCFRNLRGFTACACVTFSRKVRDLEDILLQAVVWTVLPRFCCHRKPARLVGIQRLYRP